MGLSMIFLPINANLIIFYGDSNNGRKVYFDSFCELRVPNGIVSPISILNDEFNNMKLSCRRNGKILIEKKIILRTFYNTWISGINPLECGN